MTSNSSKIRHVFCFNCLTEERLACFLQIYKAQWRDLRNGNPPCFLPHFFGESPISRYIIELSVPDIENLSSLCCNASSEAWTRVLFPQFHALQNFKMAETDVLEVEVDDRADFTEDTGEGMLKES